MVLHETTRQRSRFRIATAMACDPDPAVAISSIATALGVAEGSRPDFLTVHYGGNRAAQPILHSVAAAFAGAALHGGSSCSGVMTGHHAAVGPGGAIGAFAIHDPDGAYGSAMEPLGTSARASAARALTHALRHAGRAGEAPDLIWLTASPGSEEAVLAGIRDVVGSASVIVGGSAADDRVEGAWSMFDAHGVASDAVVVSAMFPSVPFACAFESGYAPTGARGTVTAASGRTIHSIDGRPAAEVYRDWTGGRIVPPSRGSASILSAATLAPLGLAIGAIADVGQHLLIHPAAIHADGRLEVFAEIAEGQELSCMTGSTDSLVHRAARIVGQAKLQLGGDRAAGALVIYCGGCMLAVRDRMDEVAVGLARSLDDAPYLGIYTFGEQGELLIGEARHGNLMIACVVFADDAAGSAGRVR